MKIYLWTFLLLFTTTGCHKINDEQPKAPPIVPYQRFLPYHDSHELALDTKTGRLCKTWHWENNLSKEYEFLESCSDLIGREQH